MGCTVDRSWRRKKDVAPFLRLLGSWFLLLTILVGDISTVGGFVVTNRPTSARRTQTTNRKGIGDSTLFLSEKDVNAGSQLHAKTRTRPENDTQQQRNNSGVSPDITWINRMNEYLINEKIDIFRGNNVAVVLSSLPSKECIEIASRISNIASNAHRLSFVVSPQDTEAQDCVDDDDNASDALATLMNTKLGASNATALAVVESIDFDDLLDTDAIDVVVLSTRSWRVVHDDSFINDFLRRTDAWIHMGSEFSDEFAYYARLQEGANITLW